MSNWPHDTQYTVATWEYRSARCAVLLYAPDYARAHARPGEKAAWFCGYAQFNVDPLGINTDRISHGHRAYVEAPGGLSYARRAPNGTFTYGYDRNHLWDQGRGSDVAEEWSIARERRHVEAMVDSILTLATLPRPDGQQIPYWMACAILGRGTDEEGPTRGAFVSGRSSASVGRAARQCGEE